MNFSILYAFTSPDLDLVEIKRADLAADAPIGDVYKWLAIEKKSGVTPLTFKAMERGAQEYREFKEGTLKFDHERADFRWQDTDHQLVKVGPMLVPDQLLNVIQHFLLS